MSTAQGLTEFASFISRNGGEEAKLWGNGSDFDNVIVGSLFDSFGLVKPWSYGRNRCYRTMKRMFGEGVNIAADGSKERVLYLNISTQEALSETARQRISDWFKVRTGANSVLLRFDAENAVKKRPSAQPVRHGRR